MHNVKGQYRKIHQRRSRIFTATGNLQDQNMTINVWDTKNNLIETIHHKEIRDGFFSSLGISRYNLTMDDISRIFNIEIPSAIILVKNDAMFEGFGHRKSGYYIRMLGLEFIHEDPVACWNWALNVFMKGRDCATQ